MLRDAIVAIRTLLHRPGYSAAVVITLAFGIGASTMMFSLLDAAVLRPLPFADPERLVTLLGVAGPERDVRGASFLEIGDWRTMNRTLEAVAIYDETSVNLRVGSDVIRVDAEMVSPAYFDILGVRPSRGRVFNSDEDEVPDKHPVAVISDRLWLNRFGRRTDVLATTIFLNDRPFSIVGVMPENFAGVSSDSDIWFPSMLVSLTSSPGVVTDRGTRWLAAIARLKPGVSIAQAQEDLTRVAAVLEQEHPATNKDRGVDVVGTQDALLGQTGGLLSSLFAAVVAFLMMACANVAGLQLARTIARRREMAVRLALGASRWHIVRSLLTESLLLACAAGVLGALLASWSLSATISVMPAGTLPPHAVPAIDLRALLFAALAAAAAGTLVGVLAACTVGGRSVVEAISQGRRSAAGGLGALRRRSAQQLLVVGEIALATALLSGAGLLVRSLDRQLSVDLGFAPAGVTIARASLPAARYGVPERQIFVERLHERLARLPGVSSVSVSSDVPLDGAASASMLQADSRDELVRYYRHLVTPGFFETLRIPVAHGRDFTRRDTAQSPPVAIVNEAGARRLWGSTRAALGRHFRISRNGPAVEVVGIVPNARFRDLTTDIAAGGAEPDVFFPFLQRTDRDLALALRSRPGMPMTVEVLQQAVSELDPGIPVYEVRALGEAVARQTSTARFGSALLTIFSAGALLLAAIGLYGLVSYVVGLSTGEIAIRLALGGDPSRIVRLILRSGLILVGFGLVLGAAGAFIGGRMLQGQLFETESLEPTVHGLVATLLTMVAAAATALPARRAARVDPQQVLRTD
jgi:putative ABC transport system permease protein